MTMAKLATTITQLGASARPGRRAARLSLSNQVMQACFCHQCWWLPLVSKLLALCSVRWTCNLYALQCMREIDRRLAGGPPRPLTVESVQHLPRHVIAQRSIAGHRGGEVKHGRGGDRDGGGLRGQEEANQEWKHGAM